MRSYLFTDAKGERHKLLALDAFDAGWQAHEQGFADSALVEERPLTILDIAMVRGAKEDERGGINAGEFERLGLPFFCGCQDCGASLAAYNAYPSTSGYTRCKDCIDDRGFMSSEDFDAHCVAVDAEEDEPCPA